MLLFPSLPVMAMMVVPGGVPETVALWLQLVPKANRNSATPRAANRSLSGSGVNAPRPRSRRLASAATEARTISQSAHGFDPKSGPAGGPPYGGGRLTERVDSTVVVTVIVAAAVVAPFNVRADGDHEQLDAAGTPPQLSSTTWLNPFDGVTYMV